MRQWVKDAHRTIREAKAHAIKTSDARLHMACVRSIEAMIADALLVPSDLRTYARQTRLLYGHIDNPKAGFTSLAVAE